MLTLPREGALGDGDIRVSPWNENYIYIRRASERDNRKMLKNVLGQLVQPTNGCYIWEGSVSLRLQAIVELHSVLIDTEREHDEPTYQALLYWFLRLHISRSDPETGDEVLSSMLNDFLLKVMKGSPRAFLVFCSSLTSTRISGPLDTILNCIQDIVALLALGGRDASQIVTAGLDGLFRYFLQTENAKAVNLPCPSARDNSLHSLSVIINCASRGLELSDHEDCWWKISYSWLHLLKKRLVEASEDQASHLRKLVSKIEEVL
jgi:hypothetical protein